MSEPQVAWGLDGVVVCETRLSAVDGERGRLIVAGEDIEHAAQVRTFPDLFSRLLVAAGGDPIEPAAVAHGLGEGRALGSTLLPKIGDALALPDAMEALRACAAHVTTESPAIIAGALCSFAAAWARRRAGQEPIAADPSLSHAADSLRMQGLAFDEPRIRAQNAYWVTVADHGMNASTFTARVIASTGSDLVSAIVGGIGALKGPLHGGAPGPVLDMLDEIGQPARAEPWLEGELAAGRRIMGMGHRIYRVRDPRAAVLESAIGALSASGVSTERLSLARAVEAAAEGVLARRYPNRPLRANVEFYTAVLLDALGLDRAQFAATFAVGRVAGWCAHVIEQRRVGRLIRPESRYVGAIAAA
jgi:citrate synthase